MKTSKTSVTFVCRSVSAKKNATAKLYVQVRNTVKKINLLFSTPVKVTVCDWKKAHSSTASAKSLNAYKNSEEGMRVDEQLRNVTEQITLAVEEGANTASELQQRINSALLVEARITARKAEKLEISAVLPFFDRFIDGVEKGLIRDGRKGRFGEASKNFYKSLRHWLGIYLHEDKVITFDDLIINNVADGFLTFCEDNKLSFTTYRGYFQHMAALCRRAYNQGLVSPEKLGGLIAAWKTPTPKEGDIKEEIALSEEEVNALWEYSNRTDIKSIDRLVADMALAGIESLQRFSDFSRFAPDMIRDIDGRKFISLIQDKTTTRVNIPCMGVVDFRLAEIMERNNNDFTKLSVKTGKVVPKVSYGAFCTHLRKILKELSKEVPTLAESAVSVLSHDEISMEKDFIELQKKREDGTLQIHSNEYYRWFHDSRIQKDNGAWGTKYLFRRNTRGEVMKYRWQMVSSHTCRRTGITLALDKGIFSREQIKKISGHLTDKAFNQYDKRSEKDIASNIFDVAEAAMNRTTKVVSMTNKALWPNVAKCDL